MRIVWLNRELEGKKAPKVIWILLGDILDITKEANRFPQGREKRKGWIGWGGEVRTGQTGSGRVALSRSDTCVLHKLSGSLSVTFSLQALSLLPPRFILFLLLSFHLIVNMLRAHSSLHTVSVAGFSGHQSEGSRLFYNASSSPLSFRIDFRGRRCRGSKSVIISCRASRGSSGDTSVSGEDPDQEYLEAFVLIAGSFSFLFLFFFYCYRKDEFIFWFFGIFAFFFP